MQVTKFRIAADDNGLVPAGRYFAKLARGLEDANTRQAKRREKLNAEDRKLEASYRRTSAARGNTYVPGDSHAMM